MASHGKSPCNGVGGFVKRYVANCSLQRPLHDQILSYQSMLDLCVREIPSITFFSVSQEEMVNVHADLEDHFAKSKTVLGTRSSPHFTPICCNKIAHLLTSEDRSFFNLFRQIINQRNRYKRHQVFFICQLYLWYILVGWHSDQSECT